MKDEEVWDGLNIPTPLSDILHKITKRLEKLYLMENGLLDIEVNKHRSPNMDGIRETLGYLKDTTIKLTHQIIEASK